MYPVGEELSSTWELSSNLTKLFNEREGLICIYCGANKRAQVLAQAILNSKYGFSAPNLVTWVTEANTRKLRVCELNSCHELHKTLIALKHLTYAEYGTKTEEDIEHLSYKDDQFDLLLHSETLEHVNNPDAAMDECRRVIKTDGLVIFTTPIIWGRTTRRRAKIENGKIIKLLPASHHGYSTDDYLVFSEFGSDIGDILKSDVAYADTAYQTYAFVTTKTPLRVSLFKKLKYKAAEHRAMLAMSNTK